MIVLTYVTVGVSFFASAEALNFKKVQIKIMVPDFTEFKKCLSIWPLIQQITIKVHFLHHWPLMSVNPICYLAIFPFLWIMLANFLALKYNSLFDISISISPKKTEGIPSTGLSNTFWAKVTPVSPRKNSWGGKPGY